MPPPLVFRSNMTPEELAVAELAGLVGGHLRNLDQSVVEKSSTGISEHIHPQQFIRSQFQPNIQQTTNNTIIPRDSIIEEPKSRPAGSEILGVEAVDIRQQLIPTGDMDAEMKAAIARYSNKPIPNNPAPNKPVEPIKLFSETAPVVDSTFHDTVINSLKEINLKLDLLLKRAKIVPRYKKIK